MKLFYYQRPDGQPNFGDELNHWMWPKLCPALFDHDDSKVFIGTGTLLNTKLAERIHPAKELVIFSTGAGYEQPLTSIPESWKIYCVRGPLSAKLLGLPPEKAIADGGLLIAKLFTAHDPKQGCSFMPHIHYANDAGESWQSICQQANIRYIDPRWPIETVLEAIGSSELLLAEAMHGAIAADALRVPWIPIVTGPRIYTFKWQDWCASMALPYRPHRLPPLSSYRRWGRGVRSGMQAMQHWVGSGLCNVATTTKYGFSPSESIISDALTRLSHKPGYLSLDTVFQRRLQSLHEAFEVLIEFRHELTAFDYSIY